MRISPRPVSGALRRPRAVSTIIVAVAVALAVVAPTTAASAAATAVGPGTYEETSSAVVYTGKWTALKSGSASGGAIRYARHSASAQLTFTSTSVTWYTWKSASTGKSTISIDGKAVKTVDNYAATTKYRVAYTIDGLSPGTHTIAVTSTGSKNASSRDLLLHVDSFVVGAYAPPTATPTPTAQPAPPATAPVAAAAAVAPGTYEETSSSIVYTGKWTALNSGSSSGGAIRHARHSASAELTFTSTSVTWYTWKSKSAGISNIYIDGQFVKAADNYASATKYRIAYTFEGLSEGTHTIRVATAGSKNAGSTDRLIHVDSFVVGGYADKTAVPAAPSTSFRYSACPAATVNVETSAALDSALRTVKPGTTIRLAPGTYKKKGGFALSVAATEAKPVWICGPRTAILTSGTRDKDAGLRMDKSAHVHLAGFSVADSLQGVMVKASRWITVTDLSVRDTGYEGIHLYAFTTDSTVMHNQIQRTGRKDVAYGEGVYIGTSPNRWDVVTAGQPDTSDRNTVANNDITDAGAEPIEAKAGTSKGVIYGNTIRGALTGSRALGWILTAGDDWTIRDNRGDGAVSHGIHVQSSGTWGKGNKIAGNTGTGVPGFGVYVTAAPSYGTLVTCDNRFTSVGSGQTNVVCIP